MYLLLTLLALVSTDTAMYRGDFARTGVFESEPITELEELWWMLEVNNPFQSPAISDSFIFISSSGFEGFLRDNDYSRVYAIHREYGAIRWWMNFPSGNCTNISTANGVLYVGCDSWIYAIDPQLARVIWEYDGQGNFVSAPLVYNGIVYMGSTGGGMYAFRAGSGELQWSFNASSSISSAPSTDGTHLYFCCEDGRIYALDIDTGLEIWNTDTYIGITSTPAICYDNLYITGKDGLYCIDASSGEIEWTFEVDFYTNSSPAVSDSVVYFGDHSHYLYAIDASRPWSNWRFMTEGADVYSPVIAGNVIYFGDSDGYLYALDKNTGDKLWRYWVGYEIGSSPVVFNGVIYFSCNSESNGLIYALR